jgi:hypothetical protein
MTTAQAKREFNGFAYNALGSAAVEPLDPDSLSRSSLASPAEQQPTSSSKHWGDSLRPHHFNFLEVTAVRPRLTTRPDIVLHAVSVLGAGSFMEKDDSKPVPFENGGIIVKAGERYKFFSFEFFQEHFVLANGDLIQSFYQIDMQTPRK